MWTPTKEQRWAFAIALVLMAFLAYQPVWHAGFIWDDNILIVDYPLVTQPGGWWRVWCSTGIGYPIPAVSTVWWLEWHLWGNYPPAFHWVNIAIEAGAALMLWRVLRRLKMPGAGLAPFIFLLHPVNVATTAWVAEQKNTQAMVFSLATVWFYLRFDESNKWRFYAAALGGFFLALASKTAAAPLPLVLLGIAAWKNGAVTGRDLARSIPFFALSGVAAALTVIVHAEGELVSPFGPLGLFGRIARAGRAVWFYLGKLAWPAHLMAIYPKWTIRQDDVVSYLPALALLALLAVFYYFRKSWGRPALFALAYFLLMILPVLGFVDITTMRYTWVSDHWQYFAMIGPVVLLAAGLEWFVKRKGADGWLVVVLVLTTLAVLTWRQSRIYESGEAFWAEFMRVNQPAIAAYDQGNRLLSHGKTQDAMDAFRKALKLQPAFALPYNSIGQQLMADGKMDLAKEYFEEAIQLRPDFPEAQGNLGGLLLAQSQTAEGLTHLQRSADLRPADAQAQYHFGNTLLRLSLSSDALTYLRRAVTLRPGFAEALSDMGSACEQLGQIKNAIAWYQKALAARPNFLPACNDLAWLLATTSDASLRDDKKAVSLAERANALSGRSRPRILETLAAAYAQAGDFTNAIVTVQRGLALAASQGDAASASMLNMQLKLYQAHQPLREK